MIIIGIKYNIFILLNQREIYILFNTLRLLTDHHMESEQQNQDQQ